LFFALSGEKFDAHEFLEDVVRHQAACLVVEQGKIAPGIGDSWPILEVSNTRRALGAAAASYRRGFSLPVIAVAGSNGKTSTKELLASILRQAFPTLASPASFNNEIGVPLTLLELAPEHRAAVLEVGTNHPGELAPLLQMIQPSMGVLTSIGREHLEFFGDLKGVAQEEGTIAEMLPKDGIFFVNTDSPFTTEICQRSEARIVRIGSGKGSDWWAESIQMTEAGVTFQVRNSSREDLQGTYQLKLIGRHQVGNALLAMAVAAELGLSRDQISRGLAECQPAKMRLQPLTCNGVRLINDAYNANADSTIAGLKAFEELPCHGRRFAVLGEMAELGSASPAAHSEVGRIAAGMKFDALVVVGTGARLIAESAQGGGSRSVRFFPDIQTAGRELQSEIKPGDCLYLKGSRSVGLEKLVEFIAPEGKENPNET
jgi:UDP-N-acetylmuramoyl-tripeptide--D-alanyl-D-alanine ligase